MLKTLVQPRIRTISLVISFSGYIVAGILAVIGVRQCWFAASFLLAGLLVAHLVWARQDRRKAETRGLED